MGGTSFRLWVLTQNLVLGSMRQEILFLDVLSFKARNDVTAVGRLYRSWGERTAVEGGLGSTVECVINLVWTQGNVTSL